jgi:hypothetical protein
MTFDDPGEGTTREGYAFDLAIACAKIRKVLLGSNANKKLFSF